MIGVGYLLTIYIVFIDFPTDLLLVHLEEPSAKDVDDGQHLGIGFFLYSHLIWDLCTSIGIVAIHGHYL